MKIYLDNSCYNRPFDERTLMNVKMECDALASIHNGIRTGIYDLVWSYMNEYENDSNPYDNRRESIQSWKHYAKEICYQNEMIIKRSEEIQSLNVKPKDAAHLACAIESKCNYFIATDYPLVRKAALFSDISIINPINFILEMEKYYETRIPT
jgi:predicted nucleic acid-binding protein